MTAITYYTIEMSTMPMFGNTVHEFDYTICQPRPSDPMIFPILILIIYVLIIGFSTWGSK